MGGHDLGLGMGPLDGLVDRSHAGDLQLLLLGRPGPEHGEGSSRAQDAMDLRHRRVAPEVVEGVAHDDGVDPAVVERHRLRRRHDRSDRRESFLQDRSHVARRLHGDHVDTELQEPTREAARARREVDHTRTGAETAALGDPGDRLRRVLGPELVVVERVDDLEAEAFGHD